ncbi:heat stress transcription factor A-8-like [Silene latifolia]|uniref:heat stress transcription factor A-8-like n=1 Tax=Silene latifolia TaxID=37657 RepID=UPI003D76CC7C
MTKRGENEGNIVPFLAKCYEMVNDETTDAIISWSQSNDSFIVWNMAEFTGNLLPKFFKHNKFSSFMRQLNIYGFRKVDTDRWEFANERFIKGETDLLKSIQRRKNIKKNSQPDQPTIDFSEKVDFNLEKEVEILKTDKIALMQELSKLSERQESSQDKLLLLRERLQGMENDQQQLLSFLVMVMHSPGLLVQLLKPKENIWRRTKSGKFTLDQEIGLESTLAPDKLIVRYQPLSNNEPSTMSSLSVSDKKLEQDLSFNGIEDFFMNFKFPTPQFDESLSFPGDSGSLPPKLDLEKLEQFLLSSPTRDSAEEADMDEDESLEVLTAKMGCLSPGRKFFGTGEWK